MRLLPKPLSQELTLRYPKLGLAVIQQIVRNHDHLVERLASLAHESVRQRLIRVLLELEREYGIPEGSSLRIALPLKLGDLAEMIGASRQATCTELQRLRASKMIDVLWPRIILCDPDKLRKGKLCIS